MNVKRGGIISQAAFKYGFGFDRQERFPTLPSKLDQAQIGIWPVS
jgi:hypothetical protein